MTAYGRGEYELGASAFTAEIRSVNNRYRDLILRIPKSIQVLEDEIRSLVFSRIKRGRIEVSIQAGKNGGEPDYDLELNRPLVRSYLKIVSQLSEEFGLEKRVSPESLCQMKDVILMKSQEVDVDESQTCLMETLTRTLDSLEMMRIQEGKAIEEDFRKRLDLIEEYIDRIEERSPVVTEEYGKRLRERIRILSEELEIDEGRMAQEVAFFAEKSDITEEIVRARSHLNQFREYMAMDDAIGRRLDFLIQEMNREINTIGAKASDSQISARTVEVKSELEKLREQAQNVE